MGILNHTMPRSTRRPHGQFAWLRNLCRSLALVAQLLAVLVPLSEGHEERVLASHVEAPRTSPHVGHRPDVCPACTLLGIHSQIEEPPRLRDLVVRLQPAEPSFRRWFARDARSASNSSRAPPHSA